MYDVWSSDTKNKGSQNSKAPNSRSTLDFRFLRENINASCLICLILFKLQLHSTRFLRSHQNMNATTINNISFMMSMTKCVHKNEQARAEEEKHQPNLRKMIVPGSKQKNLNRSEWNVEKWAKNDPNNIKFVGWKW